MKERSQEELGPYQGDQGSPRQLLERPRRLGTLYGTDALRGVGVCMSLRERPWGLVLWDHGSPGQPWVEACGGDWGLCQ